MIFELSKGNSCKKTGVILEFFEMSDEEQSGRNVGKTPFGADLSCTFKLIKSAASPACSKCPVKLPATPKVAMFFVS